jgi:hypothetical protein
MQQEALGRTRSAMSAMDAEIRGHFATLNALKASRALELGNIPAFYDEVQRVLRGQPDWLTVRLALATETPLFDTAVRLGGQVVPLGDPQQLPPGRAEPPARDQRRRHQRPASRAADARAGPGRWNGALRHHGAARARDLLRRAA